MTMEPTLFLLFLGLIPTFVLAFGVTATILKSKHKIGDLSDVEFSRHLSKTILQFECSEKELEKKLEKDNVGR